MSGGAVHVIGAGIAGLSAAVRLVDVGRKVIVHEAASFAGGRCRSYLDPTLGLVIDNGNHLLVSGNHEALDYLEDDSVLEQQPLERLAGDGRLGAYRHDGFWDCMDTYKDAVMLNDLWSSGEAPWRIWKEAALR